MIPGKLVQRGDTLRKRQQQQQQQKWLLQQITGFTQALRIVYVASYVSQELFYIAERVFVGNCSVM